MNQLYRIMDRDDFEQGYQQINFPNLTDYFSRYFFCKMDRSIARYTNYRILNVKLFMNR